MWRRLIDHLNSDYIDLVHHDNNLYLDVLVQTLHGVTDEEVIHHHLEEKEVEILGVKEDKRE